MAGTMRRDHWPLWDALPLSAAARQLRSRRAAIPMRTFEKTSLGTEPLRASLDAVTEQAGSMYAPLGGDRHRHGAIEHAHPHRGPHAHEHSHSHPHGQPHSGHGHSHGLVDDSIKRSREGIRAVALSLAVLGATAVAQTLIFVLSGS